ncbi:MAG: FtsX-like permease family protein [Bacteroidales bacterium]
MKLSNYLKLAIRNVKRRAGAHLVNILGLSMGLAVAMLISLYIKHETQYDRFFDDSEQIYRTISQRENDGNYSEFASTLYDVAVELNDQVPEVSSVTRIFRQYRDYVFTKESHYGQYKYHYVDSAFFNVFSYKIVQGTPRRYLSQPNKVVLTNSVAESIFGQTSPLGEEVKIDEKSYEVIGVMEDPPAQSHLKFDMLLSINSFSQQYLEMMGSDFHTYFKLQGPLTATIAKKIKTVAAATVNEAYKPYGITYDIGLQALTDIHLKTDFPGYIEDLGNPNYLYIFGCIALFLLIIALFNYINMSLATAEQRKREIAIRKATGAMRQDIKKQFLTESLFTSLLAFILAMFWVESFITPFSSLMGSTLALTYPADLPWILIFIVGALVLGIASGAYPAFYISRMRTQNILRPQVTRQARKFGFRNAMLVTQFVLTLALVATLLGFRAQLQFLLTTSPGYQTEQVVVFSGFTNEIQQHYQTVRQECKRHPAIIEATGSMHRPGARGSGQTLRRFEEPEKANRACMEYKIQPGFVKTYGLELLAGRDFSEERSTDSSSFILNEAAAKMIGGDVLGEKVMLWRFEGRVIGIVKNFHALNLHHEIGPLALSRYMDGFYVLSVRFKEDQEKEVLNHITSVLKSIDPSYIPNHQFMSDINQHHYRKETQSAKLISVGALLAIALSALGLFSLTSYQLEQRTKEIGIRKVLGASGNQLNGLLIVHYLKFVLMASILGLPIAYWLLLTWFQDFAYHADITWWYFAGALALTLIIAFASIIAKTTRVTQLPPVYSLRDE